MKIVIQRKFEYQDGVELKAIEPGVYNVPGDISKELAAKILMWGKSSVEKKAPENKKLGKAPENKAKVAKRTKRSRRTGAKSKQ